MIVRSLAEAAQEVLNASRGGGMPFQKGVGGTDVSNPLETVHDLGGATYDNPAGALTGRKIADQRPQSTPPKGPVTHGDKDDDRDIEHARGKQPGTETAGDVFPDASIKDGVLPPSRPAGKHSPKGDVRVVSGQGQSFDYAKPVKPMGEEEIVDESEEVLEEEELTEEEIEAARDQRREHIRGIIQNKSVKEDVNALFSGETLSEDFKAKVEAIFEAAVVARAVEVAEVIEEEILESAESALLEARAEIENQVDSYLNFVVENWVKENSVAIESGLRSEVVEDFISGLKNLFAEHYIDIPAEKVDVVAEQSTQIEELNVKINDALNANIELTKKLSESTKNEILSTVCEGLTATQAAKVKTLAEGVEFTTEGEYSKKLQLVRESYFASGKVKQDSTSSVVALTESESPAHVEEEISHNMSIYVNAIDRTQK